jgi:hypothetical protein
MAEFTNARLIPGGSRIDNKDKIGKDKLEA